MAKRCFVGAGRFGSLFVGVLVSALSLTALGCKRPSSETAPACGCRSDDPLCSCAPGTTPASTLASVGSSAPREDEAGAGTQPGTPALASAATADERNESICSNIDTWSLVNALDCGMRADDRRLGLDCTDSLANVALSVARTIDDGRLDASKKKQVLAVLADAVPTGQVKALSTVEATIRSHPARPGEQTIRQSFIDDYDKVLAAYRAWSTVMRGYDGTNARVIAQTEKTRATITAVTMSTSARLVQCRSLRTSAAVPASSPGPSATGTGGGTKTVRIKCPIGQTATSVRMGCLCSGSGDIQAPCAAAFPDVEGNECVFQCPR